MNQTALTDRWVIDERLSLFGSASVGLPFLGPLVPRAQPVAQRARADDKSAQPVAGIKTFRKTTSIDLAAARLRQIARYRAGWDGRDASAPNRKAITEAIDFIGSLATTLTLIPAPHPDGAVEITAEGPNGLVRMFFEGDGEAFLAQRPKQGEMKEFSVEIRGLTPPKLVREALEAITKPSQ